MKSLTDCYELNNGVKIPCIGFGTWQAPDGQTAYEAVKAALGAGYRHIDTAAAYGNEESVGKAIAGSGIDRKELFVTSKLWNEMHGYENTLKGFDKTLKDLGLDYLDLYLIHWPNPIKYREHWQETNAGTWKAFEELYRAGLIRAIGVSNFLPHHLEEISKTAEVAPMVNQIRLCPGETQPEVVKYCRSHNMLLEAYSPMGTGRIFEVPEMKTLAEKYGRSIAQICIRWSLQMGYLPLPKSVTPARIQENTQVFDFELSPEDVSLIAGLTECCGPTRDPDTAPF
ncbi:aldo/keto reductase [Cuneatibacter caecimuris]|uniref:Diketogulonate reductase-like aldo/keto reductase n=1 Tax=Cuneatibacter caecimuris TaxID=1796618 RepID=A0A4Q7PNJ8_9FIRM|nr:aldo/keto reductase [Cuneatibacter caecimuris]RZT02373.1 diketogulonate reductase-like aldo/keto reductase [Cuneatibacter caecimuris]